MCSNVLGVFCLCVAMPAAGLARRLYYLLKLFHEALAPEAASFPEIQHALQQLQHAVVADLPRFEERKRKRGRDRPVGASLELSMKSLRNKLGYARRCRAKAEADLRDLQLARERDGPRRMTAAFVAKVALASPSASSRAFAETWADLVGSGAAGCSRRTIGRVRDAFSSVIKDIYLDQLEESARLAALALACPSALAPGSASALASAVAPATFAVVLHFHDEASLRLRSATDVSLPLSRSRSSSVLQHSVWVDVCNSGQRCFVPTELCALANKRATVIARSLKEVLQMVGRRVHEGFGQQPSPVKPWLTHVLVGDGLPTNEAMGWVQGMGINRG